MKSDAPSAAPVGVVIATHTDFGARLLKAADFIIGPQEHCLSISIDVSHEVELTLAAIKEAIAATDRGAGVLVVTDMFGGTPTNLSLSLLGTGRLEVVTGGNLPMLIKILTSRTVPWNVWRPRPSRRGARASSSPGGVAQKGGRGLAMHFVRIDNRLVHGQVIETWLPHTRATMIVVVNDELSGNVLRQEIMSLAIPDGVEIVFLAVADVPRFFFPGHAAKPRRADPVLLVRGRQGGLRGRVWLRGPQFGESALRPGEKQVCPHVALSKEDERCLRFFTQHGVKIDFRCVPGDSELPRAF
jgi:mannose/fructose/N-acetylgalactosamine-specific phosphotransferase system component IIB/mannose/fructose-specific phosphotransferase system component IIA